MFASVAVDLALDRLFSYSVPESLAPRAKVGQLVRVPFRSRTVRGFVLSLENGPPRGVDPAKVRSVIAIEDDAPFFSSLSLRLVRWIADYTASPLETALKTAMPASVLKKDARARVLYFVEPKHGRLLPSEHSLTPKRRRLLDDIRRTGGGWLHSLAAELSAAPSLFKALEKAGFIDISRRERRRNPLAGRAILPSSPLPLNEEQAAALETIRTSAKPVLLYGVTGSGKTEVYLQAIAGILSQGRGAIVLVPEISLTPQTARRFAARFGGKVALLHSALSPGERFDEWRRIRSGEARVVVGPRSAVFAPVENLGLIVVDEEHDSSYKQDETPRYNARDTAVMRANIEGAKVVLGSATPSLESWNNALTGKYTLAKIGGRVNGNPMPPVTVVDMNEEVRRAGFVPVVSSVLAEAVKSRLDAGEQTILFLNRRGFSRSLQCEACGWTATCPSCETAFTYHIADDCLRCHICGGWERTPAACPQCGARSLKRTGIGTQRAEAAVRAFFKHARILRMDADTVSRKDSHDSILSQFRAGGADILLGTQMIAKGLDFPNVTLVGVLNADISLHLPDPRASERTFQLLAQVAGRAGRADLPGEVVVQTFSPEAPPVAAVAAGCDFERFAARELECRREAAFPPFVKLASVIVKSDDPAKAAAWAGTCAKSFVAAAAKNPSWGMLVSGAAEAAIAKANGLYRWQVTVRAKTNTAIAGVWKWIRGTFNPPQNVKLSIDIDALNLL